MRLLYTFSQLSPSVLALILSSLSACASQSLPWPYNLPPHEKYYPEDEPLVKRNNDIMERLQKQQPGVVRKMSPDPGEMFFLDYWLLDTEDHHKIDGWTNTSSLPLFEPPTPLHAAPVTAPGMSSPQFFKRYLRLPIPAADLFSKRDFACPSGTNACLSIGRPNSCCPGSSTCQIVPDTGLGDVGCCDAAQTCAGSLSQCPAGYTGCPNNPGGGCCLPGYACFQEGCVQTSTTVVLVTPSPTSTSSSAPLPPSTIIDTTTVIVTPPLPSTSSQPPVEPSSTTITTTETITSSPSPTSSQANSLVCSPGFRSCPASLGGGCCSTDRGCARDACPALSSTASLEPPVRGTSSSPTSTSTSTGIIPGCPTGFYACSAYNPGGCCQVDRDCSSTSCPARTGATLVASGSITIVAPSGTPVSQGPLTGSCARGWSTCDSNFGGGCCPSGYICGTAACTASVSGLSATQGKIAPNVASRLRGGVNSFEVWGYVGVVALGVWMWL